MTKTPRTIGALAAGLLMTLAAACGGSSEASTAQADTVTIQDPWVKAATADEMTAAFGTLSSSSDEDVTVVSATADATETVELHEMTTDEDGQMVMQRKEGGFVVPAGETLELSPGGNHLMFLDLPSDIDPGQDVRVTLTFSDDSQMSFTAPARSFSGAEEDYDPESGTGSAGEMDMGGHEGHDHGDDEGHDHDHE